MNEEGIWRTIRGHHVLIKDGQILWTNKGISKVISKKVSQSEKNEDDTLERLRKEEERADRIEKLEQELVATELLEKGEKHTLKIKKGDKEYYVRETSNHNFMLTKKEEAICVTNPKKQEKFQKYINDLKQNGYTVSDKVEKNIVEEPVIKSGSKRENYEKEIFALRMGFDSYEDYRKDKKIQNDKKIENMKRNFENSYVGTHAKKGMDPYNILYDPEYHGDNFYNPAVFSELIKRVATKNLDIEEVYASAKSGSKFANSIYLKDKNSLTEVRISNHELPQTSEREYNHQNFGTRWDNELILNQSTMDEIVGLKTEEEFVSYVKKLFETD